MVDSRCMVLWVLCLVLNFDLLLLVYYCWFVGTRVVGFWCFEFVWLVYCAGGCFGGSLVWRCGSCHWFRMLVLFCRFRGWF